jgi:hypothetical protein
MLFLEPLIVQKAADYNPEQDAKLLEELITEKENPLFFLGQTAGFFISSGKLTRTVKGRGKERLILFQKVLTIAMNLTTVSLFS